MRYELTDYEWAAIKPMWPRRRMRAGRLEAPRISSRRDGHAISHIDLGGGLGNISGDGASPSIISFDARCPCGHLRHGPRQKSYALMVAFDLLELEGAG